VLVFGEPTDGVGVEWPEVGCIFEGEEATIHNPTAVAWFVGDELGSNLRVNAIASNEEIGRCFCAILK
jgi:hypothetical protein